MYISSPLLHLARNVSLLQGTGYLRRSTPQHVAFPFPLPEPPSRGT